MKNLLKMRKNQEKLNETEVFYLISHMTCWIKTV